MSNYIYHNKFHQTIHHTVSSPGYPDSATDPIASIDNPFLGTFFNIVSSGRTNYIGYLSDSTQWRSSFLNVKALSSEWENFSTVFNTTSSLSSNWTQGFIGYTLFNQTSGRLEETYTTYTTYSSAWLNLLNALQADLPQEITKQKNFAAVTLTPSSNIYSWNLNTAQVAFIDLTDSISSLDQPSNMKKGGEYTLIIQQDQPGNRNLAFNSAYKFNTTSPGLMLQPFGVSVIRFVSDGTYMYGKISRHYYGLDIYITYFDAGGIVLEPAPAGLYAGASFTVGDQGGLLVDGGAPFTGGTGINIIEILP